MYPVLEVYPERIKNNAQIISQLCHKRGISVTGVVKGCNNIPEVVNALIEGGIDYIADSRIKRFKNLKKICADLSTTLLRIPGLSELKEVVSFSDISLNSEIKIIELLNQTAVKLNKTHGIILMVELGDLREGIYPAEKIIEKAVEEKK